MLCQPHSYAEAEDPASAPLVTFPAQSFPLCRCLSCYDTSLNAIFASSGRYAVSDPQELGTRYAPSSHSSPQRLRSVCMPSAAPLPEQLAGGFRFAAGGAASATPIPLRGRRCQAASGTALTSRALLRRTRRAVACSLSVPRPHKAAIRPVLALQPKRLPPAARGAIV